MALTLFIIGICLLAWGITDKYLGGKGKFFAIAFVAIASFSNAAEMTEEQITFLLTKSEETAQNTENTYALVGVLVGLTAAHVLTRKINFL